MLLVGGPACLRVEYCLHYEECGIHSARFEQKCRLQPRYVASTVVPKSSIYAGPVEFYDSAILAAHAAAGYLDLAHRFQIDNRCIRMELFRS